MECTKILSIGQLGILTLVTQAISCVCSCMCNSARPQIQLSDVTRINYPHFGDRKTYDRHIYRMSYDYWSYFSDGSLNGLTRGYDELLYALDKIMSNPVSSKEDWNFLSGAILEYYRRYNSLSGGLVYWRMLDHEIRTGNPPDIADHRYMSTFNEMIRGQQEAYDRINFLVERQEACWYGSLLINERLRSLEPIVNNFFGRLALKAYNLVMCARVDTDDENSELQDIN